MAYNGEIDRTTTADTMPIYVGDKPFQVGRGCQAIRCMFLSPENVALDMGLSPDRQAKLFEEDLGHDATPQPLFGQVVAPNKTFKPRIPIHERPIQERERVRDIIEQRAKEAVNGTCRFVTEQSLCWRRIDNSDDAGQQG